MHNRRFVVLAAILALLLILNLHQHLHELIEVIRTYGTFHKLVQQHPDLLYRYPERLAQARLVPKIMHQIAIGNGNLTQYDAARQSCRQLHADWKHMLWTDDNATSFISENYPYILPHYTHYPQNIQRANIMRYAILHKFGGVYLDLDVTCRIALDSTPLMSLPLVTPGAYPAGVNNAFIATQASHPFFAELLSSVPRHDLYWGFPMRVPYVENMMSTGCMFLSNEWMTYVRQLLAGRQDPRVFILSDEQGDMDLHMLRGKVNTPLFTHGGASSWHSWDAMLFQVIGKHCMLLLAWLPIALALVAFGLYFCAIPRRRDLLRKGRAFKPFRQ